MRVLVTGANKGLGFAAALRLASEGHHVILTARDPKLGEAALARIRELVPAAVLDFVPLDVRDRSSIEQAAAQIAKSYSDGIDVLVNNAAILMEDPFKVSDTPEPLDPKVAEVTNLTNYFGTLDVTNAFLPLLRDNGRVVNVSSRMGLLFRATKDTLRKKFQDPALTLDGLAKLVNSLTTAAKENRTYEEGWPENAPAYSASKMALSALTQIHARDPQFVRRHITVNACCPGWCRTDMGTDKGERSEAEGADVMVWLATSEDVRGVTGKFYGDRARELDYEHGPFQWPK